MATTSYGSFGWVGQGFGPGTEHHWWSTPADYGSVVTITAHAVSRFDREIEVKDVRTHVDERGGRSMHFTVRNTGLKLVAHVGTDGHLHGVVAMQEGGPVGMLIPQAGVQVYEIEGHGLEDHTDLEVLTKFIDEHTVEVSAARGKAVRRRKTKQGKT